MIPPDLAILVIIVTLMIPLAAFAGYVMRHSKSSDEPEDWFRITRRTPAQPIVTRTKRPPDTLREVRDLAEKSYLRIQRDSLFGEAPEPGRVLIERVPKAVWQHVSAQDARTELTLCLENADGEQYVVVHRLWLN